MNTNFQHQELLDLATSAMWSAFWPDLASPNLILTFARQKGMLGYFIPENLSNRGGSIVACEIALNPMYINNRPLSDVLSTIAHELVHYWQHTYGKPSRAGYHNREWADEMKRIGLQPVSDKGRETGQHMDHRIITGGMFERWYNESFSGQTREDWLLGDRDCDTIGPRNPVEPQPDNSGDAPETAPDAPEAPKKRDKSKVKHSCPQCGQNAWAKAGALLLCGACWDREKGNFPVLMVPMA